MTTSPESGSPQDPTPSFQGMTPVGLDGAAFNSQPNQEMLPADAPLTPEEIEDEAVRGDFMLRWAVILIALLLGCTFVNDSQTLVRIKTGQYMQANGWLPPRTDPFSVASESHFWANLAWGLDHLLATIYRLSGGAGLSLLSGLGAAGLFYALSLVRLDRIPTWWASICAGLALVAVFPALTLSPPFVTLAGLTMMAVILHRRNQQGSAKTPWGLVAGFWIWAQLDVSVFVGAMLLVAYAIGETFLSEHQDDYRALPLWTAVAASLGITLVHPFHWHGLAASVHLFRVELPQLREYFTGAFPNTAALASYSALWTPEFWAGRSIYDEFAIALAVIALVAQLLNWKRLHWGWLLVFVCVNALALSCARFLPMAAVVNAFVATLNGQIWYLHTFRQAYTTNKMELLFSRTGRAVTVIALFGLAYLGVNGALMARTGKRIGLGLHPDLVLYCQSTANLAANQFDDRPFHIYLSQGDYLIWEGLKSFVDSRMALHSGGAYRLHLDARKSLVEGRPDPNAWMAIFDQFKLTHVLVRTLTERDVADHYSAFRKRGWITAATSSSGMVVYRPDQLDAERVKFLRDQPLNRIRDTVFRDKAPAAVQATGLREWPRAIGPYERWLMPPRETQSGEILLGQQYSYLLQFVPPITPQTLSRQLLETRTSLALQAMREARLGLVSHPQRAEGYRVMARAAESLFSIETQLGLLPQGLTSEFWYSYALIGNQAARTIDSTNISDYDALFRLSLTVGARDWALWHLEQVRKRILEVDPEHVFNKDQDALLEELRKVVGEATTALRGKIGVGQNRGNVIRESYQQGCWKLALELFEEDITSFAAEPQMQQLYAQLLLHAGRLEESWQVTESLEAMLPPPGTPSGDAVASAWRHASALSNLMNGGEDIAIERWEADRRELQQTLVRNAMRVAPTLSAPPIATDLRPALTVTHLIGLQQQSEQEVADAIHAALADLVCWRNLAAKIRLESILESYPETIQRQRIVFYLSLLSAERLTVEPPSDLIPVWTDMFAAEAAQIEDSKTDDAKPEDLKSD